MGGKALKTIEAKRLNAPEYHALVPVVLDEIAGVVGRDRPLCEIEAYRTKPDFGDMDVLVASDGIPQDYKDAIASAFRSREVVKNGSVTSFERDGFQVDVIAIASESFDYARSYFAWNDLGNLVGRIAHKMGLKHAFVGLMAPLRDGDHMFAELVVTRDVDSVLATMGYDPVRYRQGFNTLEDIFHFVASSPMFNPDIYLLENRNATARVRDSKRKTYSAFLEWLDDPDGLDAHRKPPSPGWFCFPEDKTSWTPALRAKYPDFGARVDVALERKSLHKAARQIFNGERVGELTGLKGKELGEVMRELRSRHDGQDALAAWVLAAGQKGVDEAVLECASSLCRVKGFRP